MPTWAEPAANLETRELGELLEAAIADMPAGMRNALLLVCDQELLYTDAPREPASAPPFGCQ